MNRIVGLALLTAMTVATVPSGANAAVVISIAQVGANVVATTSGTLDLTGLEFSFESGDETSISAFDGFVSTGGRTADGRTFAYRGFSPVQTFGTGTNVDSTSGSGVNFGIFGGPPEALVYLPTDFVSGGSVAGTSVFAGQTLASLGLTLGGYVFSSSNDTVIVNIGVVPEPATWATMIAGFGLVGGAIRRRSRMVSLAR